MHSMCNRPAQHETLVTSATDNHGAQFCTGWRVERVRCMLAEASVCSLSHFSNYICEANSTGFTFAITHHKIPGCLRTFVNLRTPLVTALNVGHMCILPSATMMAVSHLLASRVTTWVSTTLTTCHPRQKGNSRQQHTMERNVAGILRSRFMFTLTNIRFSMA